MLSNYNQRLLTAFNATEDDLLANRQGIATQRERALVKQYWNRLGIIGAVIAGVIILIFLSWIYESIYTPVFAFFSVETIFGSCFYLIPIFASVLFSISMFNRRDRSAQEPLTVTEGKAFIVGPNLKTRFPTVYIRDREEDEEKGVIISNKKSLLFFKNFRYKVYRIGTEIVAVESLQDPNKTSS